MLDLSSESLCTWTTINGGGPVGDFVGRFCIIVIATYFQPANNQNLFTLVKNFLKVNKAYQIAQKSFIALPKSSSFPVSQALPEKNTNKFSTIPLPIPILTAEKKTSQLGFGNIIWFNIFHVNKRLFYSPEKNGSKKTSSNKPAHKKSRNDNNVVVFKRQFII